MLERRAKLANELVTWFAWSESGLRGAGIGGAPSQEAGAAVDGPALRRIKRHCGLLSALSALHGDLDALTNSGRLSCRDRRQPLILCLLARLTTLGLVLQSFIVKEDLLSCSPDKVVAAINAFYCEVFKLTFSVTLTCG